MKKKEYFQRVKALTPTYFWVNNPTRREARLAIEAGAIGCTTNPSHVWKAMENEEEKEYVFSILDDILKTEPDDRKALLELQSRLVEDLAEYFKPIYEKSNGYDGWVSIQGDPFHEDTDSIFNYAKRNCKPGKNVIAKIPATEKGIAAMGKLVKEGISILATENMAVRQALDVCEEYTKQSEGMKNPPVFIYAHIAGIYDQHLQDVVKKDGIVVDPDALWQAGISIAKKTYYATREKYPSIRFMGGGARGLHHFTEMVGFDGLVTINWKGTADKLVEQDPPVVQRFFQPTPDSVVDELIAKIPDYKKGYLVNEIEAKEYEDFGPVVLFRSMFEGAWEKALGAVKERRAKNIK